MPRRARSRSLGMRLLRLIAAALLLAFLTVLLTMAWVWHTARLDERRPADAIVVLGAAQYSGRPSQIFKARLDHAATLYHAGVAPVVVVLGGSIPGDPFSEGSVGAAYLTSHGIAAVSSPRGRNTLQSFQALVPLAASHHWHRLELVTDPWHELRSRELARDQGFWAETSPAHTGPAIHTRQTEFHYLARETVALLYYRLWGASNEAGPSAA